MKSEVLQSTTTCSLCGLRLPKHPHFVTSNGQEFVFCCSGCRQVFVLLSESGLLEGDYKNSELYQTSLRLGIISQPTADDESKTHTLSAEQLKDAEELVLRIDGMWCSSCSWLIEKVISAKPGVLQTKVIYASDTAKIYYKPEVIAPDAISKEIVKLGYSTSQRDADSTEHSGEKKSLLIRMGIALFLMNNIMFFSYVLYISYFQDLAKEMSSLVPLILLGLTIPSVFWCGLPIHKKAYRSLINKAPTMELLFSIGIFAAFSFSVIAIVVGYNHYYFDTAASLVALLLVGKYIELSAKHKASENVNRLYQMLPKKVRLKIMGEERLISTEKLQVGDRFIVKSGEKIPADGRVVIGRAVVDEALLTGESKPIEKNIGDGVVASSINVNGQIEVETLRIGKETVLSNIIQLVEQALSTKSPLEQIVDRISRVFIPAIISTALATGIILFSTGAGFESSLLRGITILVIACPCALGMATPLAIAAGIGYAAKRGILIRDGSVLQSAAKINATVFDKTGTITEGKFVLHSCSFTPLACDEALSYLGSLEQASSHPIANAIVNTCQEKNIHLNEVTEISITDGMGIEGRVKGKQVCIGNEDFISHHGFIKEKTINELIEHEVDSGRTVIFFGIEGWNNAGYCFLGDTIKQASLTATHALKNEGIDVHLLSGDGERTTAAIASLAGITTYRAQALPQHKIEYIKELQSANKTVAMVGDGVNDAPALAQADIGFAMGDGTELAISSASVTLLRDDLTLIPETIEIARRTVRTVKQNLAWAFIYNAVGIILAIMGLLNPLMAAGAMLASSLSVVANSMRLREPKGKTLEKVLEILIPWREPANK